MFNFVLIHGAWHKPTCWDKLKPYLLPFGNIHAPNLIGEFSFHDIRLITYIDILTTLFSRIQTPIIIISHSFGGFLAREIANIFPEKIAQIIYVNALIPIKDETFFSLTSNFHYQHLNPYLEIDDNKAEIRLKSLHKIHQYMYQTIEINDLDFHHFRSEPLKPLSEPYSGKNYQIPEKAIISLNDLSICDIDLIRMSNRQNIPYHTINADHCPFFSNPAKFSKLILECIEDV